MRPRVWAIVWGIAAIGTWVPSAGAGTPESPDQVSTPHCRHFGPQTPRDIDDSAGTNTVLFPAAPPFAQLNLCNIHFHRPAEHKAKAFSWPAADSDDVRGGFRCNVPKSDAAEETAELAGRSYCRDLQVGDTVEVHWVYTSCDVQPGPGLGSCFSSACTNPSLRVEAQVFSLVADPRALDFAAFDYAGPGPGRPQARSLPTGPGVPVQFGGSTTGPSFDDRTCSPFQVTWRVRPECARLNIASLGRWCQDNVFDEDHAHGVRKLVTHLDLLAPIGH
ncbi:MAG: delta-class carbonic anhydrase [Thermoanaerobaculia bacterium]|nr:delta-class carbonic anhydrase [Thermoanaerobaculia bacterium]